jgi:hypothetical protein
MSTGTAETKHVPSAGIGSAADANLSFAAGYAAWYGRLIVMIPPFSLWPESPVTLVASYAAEPPRLHLLHVSYYGVVDHLHVNLYNLQIELSFRATHGIKEEIGDARAVVLAAVNPRCMMALFQPDWLGMGSCDTTIPTRVYAKLMTITDDDSSSSHDTVPRPNVSWQPLPSPLNTKYRSKLVVAGHHQVLSLGDVCERYDLDRKVWTPMAQPEDEHWFSRAGDACVWPPGGDTVFAFGPNQGECRSSRVLCYNMTHDRWTQIADMPVQVERGRCCVGLGDRILVLDHELRLHEYDPVKNQWATLTTWRLQIGAKLKLPRVLVMHVAYDMLFAIVQHAFANVFICHCALPPTRTVSLGNNECPGWHIRKMDLDGLKEVDDLHDLCALFPGPI